MLQLVCQKQTSMEATNTQTCKRIQDSATFDFGVHSVSLCQFGIFGCNQSRCLLPAATTCAKRAQTYKTHAEINNQTFYLVFFSMFVCWLLSCWSVFGILTPQLCIAHCGSGHSYTHCNPISIHMHSLWKNLYVIACSKLLYDLHFAVVCSWASAACVHAAELLCDKKGELVMCKHKHTNITRSIQ